MNTSRYLALFLLSMPGIAIANNTWYVDCKKGCSSCTSSSGSCGAESSTYGSLMGPYDTEKAATDAAKAAGCDVSLSQPFPLPDGATPGSSARGISAASYSRTSLIVKDVGPDYLKTETINNVRIPNYLPIKNGGIHISDVTDGFQIVKYPSSALGTSGSDGIRPIKQNGEPSSITTYRNPDGGTTTSSGKLDIVHKQRHPKTGEWVTRTIRKAAPQNNNNWATSFYLGDPMGNDTIDPYRTITITRTPNGDHTETTHEVTKDRATDGSMVITSDVTRKYAFYKHGEPVILSETRHSGTGSDLTTEWTYYTDSAQQNSFNKPATMRRTGGQWSNTTYQGNPVTGTLVTKTVSGWKNNPAPAVGAAPDENANRVVTEFEAKNETGTIGREEKIGGVIVSRTWGERYKARSGELVEKSNEQRGSATLTTIRTGYPDDDSATTAERGRLKSIQHPDGTFTLHRHTLQGENRVETVDTGTGSLSAVTDGTRTVSTYTKDDVLVSETTSDIASGIELSARQAVAFDSNDQPTRWAYDNNLEDFSETLNGCCGIDSERTRDGVLTSYTRDGLKRPKTATSQGITLTYTYGKKTINGTDFPSVTMTKSPLPVGEGQGEGVQLGTTVYDHAGNVIEQITPDLNGDGTPETTSTTHNFAACTTSTMNPDGGTSVTTEYPDGQTLSTTGTAVPDSSQETTVGNNLDGIPEAVMKTVTTRPSGTAAGDQTTTTYQAIGGLTLATMLNGVTTATYSYDSLARPVRVTDGDGVKQHTAYNAKGEAYRRATSRDGNDTIDLGVDTVSETETTIVNVDGFGPAIRTISKVWTGANTSVITSTSLQSPDGTKSSTTSPGIATPATRQSATYLDRADGSWTDTSTAPDGTKQVTTYSNWLAITQASYSSLPSSSLLSSVSTTYDSLRRPETQTDSRTGLVTTHYSTTNGQVEKIVDHNRETSFKYDEMGRRIETTLPDNSKTYTTYSVSGQPIISWGSQTYPTYTTYDEQDRRLTLRTKPTLTPAGVPTDAGGSLTTWIYFPNGQLQQKQDDDGKGATYTYTNAGRLKTRTWERNITTTYYYDLGGLHRATDYSDSTPDILSTHDCLGRALTTTQGTLNIASGTEPIDSDGITLSATLRSDSYTYHPTHLTPHSETISLGGESRTLVRSFDNYGRPEQVSVGIDTTASLAFPIVLENTEHFTGYRHGADGRLLGVDAQNIPRFTGKDYGVEYAYTTNSASLIHSIIRKGDGSAPSLVTTNHWEDSRDSLLSKENKLDAATNPVSKYTYIVNSIGQRESLSTDGTAFGVKPVWSWGYNSRGELVSADDTTANDQDFGYIFDAIGNRTATGNKYSISNGEESVTNPLAYNANSLNQYSVAKGVTLPTVSATGTPHDEDGNLRFDGGVNKDNQSHEYVWDAENRLIEVKDISVTPAVTLVSYTYDARSRRISRTVGARTTWYLYDGWNVVAEYVKEGGDSMSLSKTNTWGLDLSGTMQGAGGVGGLLAVRQLDAQSSTFVTYYPTFDGNGNVSEYLTASGSTVAHYEYDPFGNDITPATVKGTAHDLFTYQFSTKPLDSVIGWLYYGYRFYDPLTGRWPSRDPIEEEGGVNLYGFVVNDGVNGLDRLGELLVVHNSEQYKVEDENGRGRGRTPFNFKVKVETRDQHVAIGEVDVFVVGDLELSAWKSGKTEEDLRYGDWHERQHINTNVKKWNMLVAEINYLEREWCVPCHDLAMAYGNAAVALRYNEAELENLFFDEIEYPKRGAPPNYIREVKNRITNALKENKAFVSAYNTAGNAFYKTCLSGKSFIDESEVVRK
jgi:RHS repeat-associated protein